MIIKTLSRKSNVDQLIRYILKDEKVRLDLHVRQDNRKHIAGMYISPAAEKHLQSEIVDARLAAAFKECGNDIQEFLGRYIMKGDTIDSLVIKNNVRARTIDGYIEAFRDNEALRLHPRKDSVKAYHTIISLASADRHAVTEKMLWDIAQHYISLRGTNSLFLGAIHQDKEHVHIHLIQSGTQYMTGISNRVSRQAFNGISEAMQVYQKKFPELVHSVHGSNKSKTVGMKKDDRQKIKTDERTSYKSFLTEQLNVAITTSKSSAHFISQIKDMGIEAYERGGKLAGVIYGEDTKYKFRFSNLGVEINTLKELDEKIEKEEKALREIKAIRGGKPAQRDMKPGKDTEKSKVAQRFPEAKEQSQVKQATGMEVNGTAKGDGKNLSAAFQPQQYVEDSTVPTIILDNLCDDCKKEQEDPSYNNPQFYTDGVFDYNKYSDHALEEIGRNMVINHEAPSDDRGTVTDSKETDNDMDTAKDDNRDNTNSEIERDEPENDTQDRNRGNDRDDEGRDR